MSLASKRVLLLLVVACQDPPPNCEPPANLTSIGEGGITGASRDGCWVAIETTSATGKTPLRIVATNGAGRQVVSQDAGKFAFVDATLVFEDRTSGGRSALVAMNLAATSGRQILGSDALAFYLTPESVKGDYVVHVHGSTTESPPRGAVRATHLPSKTTTELADGVVATVSTDSVLLVESLAAAVSPCAPMSGRLVWRSFDGRDVNEVGTSVAYVAAHAKSGNVVFERSDGDGLRHILVTGPRLPDALEIATLPPMDSSCSGIRVDVSWSSDGELLVFGLNAKEGDVIRYASTQAALAVRPSSTPVPVPCSMLDLVAVASTAVVCRSATAPSPGTQLVEYQLDGSNVVLDGHVSVTTELEDGRLLYQRLLPELPRLPTGELASEIRLREEAGTSVRLADGYLDSAIETGSDVFAFVSDVPYLAHPKTSVWAMIRVRDGLRFALSCRGIRPLRPLAGGVGLLYESPGSEFFIGNATLSDEQCSK